MARAAAWRAAPGRMAARATSIARSSIGWSPCCIGGCAERSDGARDLERARFPGSEYRKRVRNHVKTAHRPVGIRSLSGVVGLPDRARAASAPVARHRVGCRGRAGIFAVRADPWRRPGTSSGRAEPLGHWSMHDQRYRQGVQLNMTDADGAWPVPCGRRRVVVRRCLPSSIPSILRRQAACLGASIGYPAAMSGLPST